MGIISQAAHFLNFVNIGISWTIETVIRGYLKVLLENVFNVKDNDSEKAPSNKTLAVTESMNMAIWVVGTLNQLFIRDS